MVCSIISDKYFRTSFLLVQENKKVHPSRNGQTKNTVGIRFYLITNSVRKVSSVKTNPILTIKKWRAKNVSCSVIVQGKFQCDIFA